MERFRNLKIAQQLTMGQAVQLGRCRVILTRCPKMDLLGRWYLSRASLPPSPPPLAQQLVKVERDANLEDRRNVPEATRARLRSPMPSTSRAAVAPGSFPGSGMKPVLRPKTSRVRAVTGAAVAVQVKRNHGRKGSWECLICEKIFLCWSHLEMHMRGHTEERPYDCSVCQEAFKTTGNLKAHRNYVHSEGEKRFRCGNCGKRFHQRQALQVHTRRHRREKPFRCGVCNKAFTTKDERNQHQAIHSSERPYPCDRCGKRFRRKYELSRHIRRHVGDTPHECPVCRKGFVTPSHLKFHKLTHLPASQRPYKCTQCPMGFRAPSLLRDHQNFHSGRKPYSCFTCKQVFYTLAAARNHCKTKGHRRAKTPGETVKLEIIN